MTSPTVVVCSSITLRVVVVDRVVTYPTQIFFSSDLTSNSTSVIISAFITSQHVAHVARPLA